MTAKGMMTIADCNIQDCSFHPHKNEGSEDAENIEFDMKRGVTVIDLHIPSFLSTSEENFIVETEALAVEAEEDNVEWRRKEAWKTTPFNKRHQQ